MIYTVVTPPSVEPVSLTEVKQHLRLTATGEEGVYTAEDDKLNIFIQAAREQVEFITRRALNTQTWKIFIDRWPMSNELTLPFPPLISVTHVKYYETDDTENTFTDYGVGTGDPGRIVLDYGYVWPSKTLRPLNPIEIQFVAGYGATSASVPESIRSAILMLVGHLYENRELTSMANMIEVPFAVDALLRSYRWFI